MRVRVRVLRRAGRCAGAGAGVTAGGCWCVGVGSAVKTAFFTATGAKSVEGAWVYSPQITEIPSRCKAWLE